VKNTKEQMNLFKYGGLKDDGRDKDPVSGNNVPSGSMAKEVRDDLPAMLSEGEYVVPADVVRYFGVNYFEDLRNKAKSGLTDMEKDGRIGGEPIDKPIMASQGALTTASVTNPNRYTGEFSFERPGAGSYKDDGYEAPSPTTCAAKGKTYDPILRVCVTSPIAPQAVNIPPPVTYVPRVSTSGGDDNGPQEPMRDTNTGETFGIIGGGDWYEKADWSDPQKTTEQFFQIPDLGPTVIGGIVGMTGGSIAISKSKAMKNIYEVMGDVEKAKVIDDKLRFEFEANKNLKYTDRTINAIIGSDGDLRTIRALRDAGVDVPSNLRDEEFQEYLTKLKSDVDSVRRIKNKYGTGGPNLRPKEKVSTPKYNMFGDLVKSDGSNSDEVLQKQSMEAGDPSLVAIQQARQNPITQSRADQFFGTSSGGGSPVTVDKPANKLNWEDVRQLRAYDSGANRQKLAEWEASSKTKGQEGSSHSGATKGESGCFLTTAIVEHRGEADDGPTLTKLRNFRDTYLADYPEEVKKYYQVAPKIVAAIPKDNPTWDWVGKQIDSAIEHIDNDMLDKAHQTYKSMVLELETNWLKKA